VCASSSTPTFLSDNFLFALAQTGKADYLVTGDKTGVLARRRHGKTQVITLHKLLEIIER